MKVHDNILQPNMFKKLQSTILNAQIPYYFGESTAFREKEKPDVLDYSWSHLVYEEGQQLSSLSSFLETVLLSALDNAEIEIQNLIRIRIGLITATKDPIVHDPHVDYETDHQVGLLYVHDSDGDTIIYKNTYETNSSYNSIDFIKDKKLEVLEQVKPVGNRMVFFNGLQYHSSTTPIHHNKRIAINFNYV